MSKCFLVLVEKHLNTSVTSACGRGFLARVLATRWWPVCGPWFPRNLTACALYRKIEFPQLTLLDEQVVKTRP
jgi:hypothetical protein